MEEEDEIEAAAQAHKLARVEEIPTTNNNHHHLWPSSRIVRVSRASGGKDRHSKVMTSKGLRDRRVRLSVATAIQFYDLQDRLGVDQPSKAVEWLINAAADAISELPSLNNNFAFNGDEITNYQHQKKQKQKKKEKEKDVTTVSVSASKSGCSSTSETSRGSGLSLSRNEIRVKARERARERTAKEKETASFTEMLTREINGCDEAPNLLNFNSVTGVSVSPFNDQNFSFMSDSQDYNMLNFSICSSTTSSSGYNSNNRGTLQSNCSLLPPPHMQRFQLQQPFDGSSSSANSTHNFPFLVGSAIPSAAMENHHHHLQFSPLFDARLQLSHSDHKPKPKH